MPERFKSGLYTMQGAIQVLGFKPAQLSNKNLYSPSKHGRQQTISNTNEIKQL